METLREITEEFLGEAKEKGYKLTSKDQDKLSAKFDDFIVDNILKDIIDKNWSKNNNPDDYDIHMNNILDQVKQWFNKNIKSSIGRFYN